jgi:hypothetical protein
MEDMVPFGSRAYAILLPLLLFARSMDFLSTWVATPNLVLEANPIARRLRWKWGMVVNVVLCVLFAAWPLPAIIIATTSVLVAARNFQHAWLMRSYGEENYRDWFLERLEDARPGLFLFCLVAQTLLLAALGGVLVFFGLQIPTDHDQLVPLGMGIGFVAYAVAVAVYTLLALWRNRQAVLGRTE